MKKVTLYMLKEAFRHAAAMDLENMLDDDGQPTKLSRADRESKAICDALNRFLAEQ